MTVAEMHQPKSRILSATYRLANIALYAMGLLALIAATLAALGVSPVVGLRLLGEGAFGTAGGHLNALSETLVETTPLLLTALSVMVGWRCGIFTIGADGQLLVGAAAAATIGVSCRAMHGPAGSFALVAAGAFAGALWSAAAEALRRWRRVQEVISTIMLNYLAIHLVSWLVRGPLQEPGRHMPQSRALPNSVLFARMLPPEITNGIATRLHTGVLLAFAMAPLTATYIWWTLPGLRLRIVGANAEAARSAGIRVARVRMQAMLVSGALAGLAGSVELLGITGRLYAPFSPGWGYTAIPVALLGGLSPGGIAASALFFGALTAGSGNLERNTHVSSVIIYVVQAAAVLAIVAARAWNERRKAQEG
ncbi:MAG: ABC transporter permease [Armatimonadetes bacterium]|nr:ABC transporter permease [Armatimonadota bacterium]MDE2207093.1 ABC transporter permease [Armatimonadota bacterium]